MRTVIIEHYWQDSHGDLYIEEVRQEVENLHLSTDEGTGIIQFLDGDKLFFMCLIEDLECVRFEESN